MIKHIVVEIKAQDVSYVGVGTPITTLMKYQLDCRRQAYFSDMIQASTVKYILTETNLWYNDYMTNAAQSLLLYSIHSDIFRTCHPHTRSRSYRKVGFNELR